MHAVHQKHHPKNQGILRVHKSKNSKEPKADQKKLTKKTNKTWRAKTQPQEQQLITTSKIYNEIARLCEQREGNRGKNLLADSTPVNRTHQKHSSKRLQPKKTQKRIADLKRGRTERNIKPATKIRHQQRHRVQMLRGNFQVIFNISILYCRISLKISPIIDVFRVTVQQILKRNRLTPPPV